MNGISMLVEMCVLYYSFIYGNTVATINITDAFRKNS